MADDQAKGGLIPKLAKPEMPLLKDPEPIPAPELPLEAEKFRKKIGDFTGYSIDQVMKGDAEREAPPDFETNAAIRGTAMLDDPVTMARVERMQRETGLSRNDLLAWEDINNAPNTREAALRAMQFSRSEGDAYARLSAELFGAYNTETQADTQRRGQDMTQATQGGGQVLGSYSDQANRENNVDINNATNQTRVDVANHGTRTAGYEADRREYEEANKPSVVEERNSDIADATNQPLGASRALTTSQVMGIDAGNMTPVQQKALRDRLMPAISSNLLDPSQPLENGVIDELSIVMPPGVEFNDFVSSLGIRAGTELPDEVIERIRNVYKRVTGEDPPMNKRRSMWDWSDATPNNSYFAAPEENIDNMPPQQ